MLKDVTIGQFFPGKSIIHRLDPRVKLVLILALIIALFLAEGVVSYALMIGFLLVIIKVSGIPFRMVVKGLKPILFIICFTAVLNLFYTPGEYIWQYGFLHISREGIFVAVKMVLRIMLLIIGTSMLTYTTSPIQLTDGLERLLSPLKRFHAPVHELSMMMSIALRFIPILVEETDKIMKAQIARGADLESGNILQKAKSMIPILVPLFVSAFRRANDLAMAMEARCYRGGEGRTKMNPLRYTGRDRAAYVIMILYVVGVVAIGRYVPLHIWIF